MLKTFRKMTQPTKIFLHQKFICNTFTCEEDHEKAYDLVSIYRDQS